MWVDEVGEDSNGLGSVDATAQILINNARVPTPLDYGSFQLKWLREPEVCAGRAYLTTLSADVDGFNMRVFEGLLTIVESRVRASLRLTAHLFDMLLFSSDLLES